MGKRFGSLVQEHVDKYQSQHESTKTSHQANYSGVKMSCRGVSQRPPFIQSTKQNLLIDIKTTEAFWDQRFVFVFTLPVFLRTFLPLQGWNDADKEDRFSALLLQRLVLFFRHLGHRVCHRAARTQQRHHPASYLHHGLLLHGSSNDADEATARIRPDVVRHAGTGQEDRGGFRQYSDTHVCSKRERHEQIQS